MDEIGDISDPHFPYRLGQQVDEIILDESAVFIRIHRGGANETGPWLMRLEDFQSYDNIDRILDDFAIPHGQQSWGLVEKPSRVSIVELPAGTKTRRGVVKEQEWGNLPRQDGGATQFEILDYSFPENPIPSSWFTELGSISDYLIK